MGRAWGIDCSWHGVTGPCTFIIRYSLLYILHHFITRIHTLTRLRLVQRGDCDGQRWVLWLHAIFGTCAMLWTWITRKTQLYWGISCYNPTTHRNFPVSLPLNLSEEPKLDIRLVSVFFSTSPWLCVLTRGLRLDVRLVCLFFSTSPWLCVLTRRAWVIRQVSLSFWHMTVILCTHVRSLD
jgi:hypothetical protein